MLQNWGKRMLAALVGGALVLPLLSGVLTGCSGGVKAAGDVSYYSLSQVEITDDYAQNALEKEDEYLLSLDADKLLYWFYINAGLSPKASSGYGGQWESALIGGHTMGHYLSALAQAYANAGNGGEKKDELLEKIEYIVDSLQECQENSQGEEGFLWGAYYSKGNGSVEFQFDNVEKNLVNIFTQAWVPWYTMHKIVQGLIDVYSYTGSKTAYNVVKSLGDWVYNRATSWSEATRQNVLTWEYGGMNDCMYNLYAVTGEAKYAVAAHLFDEETLFETILSEKADYLNGLHANTTIPKIIGALNRYLVCQGKKIDGETVDAEEMVTVAELFWERVVEHHTYVTGGNSEDEHFGKDDVLDAERTAANCETCNTYNMLKLSRMLFSITKDVKYLNYYENTYINAIWSSQNPETGMTTYFQPMATGYFKVYSSPESNFWCCTGSGMESMTKLNDSIYYNAGDAVYVSLYVDSTLTADKLKITQTADLENSDVVSFNVASGSTTLYLRVPDWTKKFEVSVNGKASSAQEEDGFVAVSVGKGDKITVTMEKTVVAYNLPDGENTYAFKYGPYVLSAELGTVNMGTMTHGVSVAVPTAKNLGSLSSEYINVTNGTVKSFIENINDYMVKNDDGTFTLTGTDVELTYSYHFRQYQQRYGIYFYFTGSDVEEENGSAYSYEVVDSRQPGYGQYEVGLEDNGSEALASTSTTGGTARYATAGGSFSYYMSVNKSESNYLVVYFTPEDAGKTVCVKADGTVIYNKTLAYDYGTEIYEVLIRIPDSVVSAASDRTITVNDVPQTVKNAVKIEFGGIDGAESARICAYVYTAVVTFKEELTFNGARDGSVAYFVDCGDYDTSTVSDGDKFGSYNSLTEQLYGIDYATGRYWGLVDGADPTSGTAGSACAAGGLSSATTWPYEFNSGDNLLKTSSNRYTKNQYESGMNRYLCYLFDLDDGDYVVEVYFLDPWNCSKNVCVTANGEQIIANAAVGQAVSASVTVEGGFLKLEFTTTDLCINLCYIKITFA